MAQNSGWRDGLLWGGLFPAVACLFPALAGIATGLLARRGAIRATLLVLLLILPTMTVGLPYLLESGLNAPGREFMLPFDDLLMIGWLLRNLFWVPIGCWAASRVARLRCRSALPSGMPSSRVPRRHALITWMMPIVSEVDSATPATPIDKPRPTLKTAFRIALRIPMVMRNTPRWRALWAPVRIAWAIVRHEQRGEAGQRAGRQDGGAFVERARERTPPRR